MNNPLLTSKQTLLLFRPSEVGADVWVLPTPQEELPVLVLGADGGGGGLRAHHVQWIQDGEETPIFSSCPTLVHRRKEAVMWAESPTPPSAEGTAESKSGASSHQSTETGCIRTYLIRLYSSWNTAPGRRGLLWSVQNLPGSPRASAHKGWGQGAGRADPLSKELTSLCRSSVCSETPASWMFTSSFCVFSFNTES